MANPYTSSKPFLASARGRRKETSARIDFLWTWQSRRNSDEAAVRWRTRIVWTRKYSGYIAETKKSSASVGVNSRKVNKSKGIVFLSPLPRCKRSPPPPPPPSALIPSSSDRWLSFGWWNTIFLRENFRIADGGDYVRSTKISWMVCEISANTLLSLSFFSRFSSFFALDVEIEELSRWKMR